MIVIINLRLSAGLALLLLATACTTAAENGGLTVLATNSILGDVTRQVVGDVATVEVLIPQGADPHGFQPSARQAASLRDADIVIANGLDLEAGLADVLSAAKRDGVLIVEFGPEVTPLNFTSSEELDPHFWLDPLRMSRAAKVIAISVAELAETSREELLANLVVFQNDLTALDQEVEELFARVKDRKLVTNHDSLGYLASRYGFQLVGTIVPGGSNLASPSPRDVSDLIDAIETEGVSAVFTDAAEPDSLATLIADESDGSVEVIELYIGALGPTGSGADSYVGMIRVNVQLIAGALS